jgi:methylthioribulose-1-phosphate dehydratase
MAPYLGRVWSDAISGQNPRWIKDLRTATARLCFNRRLTRQTFQTETPRVPDPMSVPFAEAITAIIAAGCFLDSRGWAPATAGNYSVRLDDGHIAITASGLDKGNLTERDILRVGFDGRPTGNGHPSAETRLHIQIYHDVAWANAVLHTHSITATVLGTICPSDPEIVLAGYELLKAFPGFDTHDRAARIPLFENTQDMPSLAAEVSARLRREPDTPGYLIRGHGLYTWGRDMTSARRHVEAMEFLFACELERKRIGR